MKLSECDKWQRWHIPKLDMSGYTFVHNALFYEVDRSIVIAERYDETQENDHDDHWGMKGIITRLYFDTLLEYPFVVIFKRQDNMFNDIHKFWWLPGSRNDLLDYCQRQFPDMLEDIMGTKFRYPDAYPDDETILRSRGGSRGGCRTNLWNKGLVAA